MNIITTILAPLVVIIAGCYFLYGGWKLYFITRNMSNWMITQGVITKSDVKPAGAASLLPDVEYRYSVLGVEYISSNVTLPHRLKKDYAVVQDYLLKEYPVGKKVDVFYNPKIHQVAVLEIDAAIGVWVILVATNGFGISCLILGIAYLLHLVK